MKNKQSLKDLGKGISDEILVKEASLLLIHLDSLMKVVEAEIGDGKELITIIEVVMQSEGLFKF